MPIGPFPNTGNGADHIENTFSNTFAIVACVYFGRCLEMGLHVTIYIFLSNLFSDICNFCALFVYLHYKTDKILYNVRVLDQF
jgi:hypothetical protein